MKVTKTYSIEETIYNAFDYLTTEKNINKSSFIEDLIKKYLKDNDMDFIDKLYYLKSDPEQTVTVISQDASFYQLSNGSSMNKIFFMSLFDEVTPISPEAFLNSSNNIFENLANKIKNLDEKPPPHVTATNLDELIRQMNENDKIRNAQINQMFNELKKTQH